MLSEKPFDSLKCTTKPRATYKYSYDFYAIAFSYALCAMVTGLAFGIDLSFRWHKPEWLLDDWILIIFEYLIVLVSMGILAFSLSLVIETAQSRIDYNDSCTESSVQLDGKKRTDDEKEKSGE